MPRHTTIAGVLAVVLIASATAAAAAGKSGGTSSVALHRYVQTTGAARSAPSFGEQVTFDVSTSRTDRPWVLNECFQGGVLVSAEKHGFFDGYLFGEVYTLGPTDRWTGGSADCTAKLLSEDHNKTQVLATTSYSVSA
jgi:hypothetical protein